MIISLTANYFVILLKSIFNKNTENYLVENALIYRAFKASIREFSRVDKFDDKEINNAKMKFTLVYLGICFVVFLLFLFFAGMFVAAPEAMVIPLIIFAGFIYFIILKNINQVARINREASEIVGGNYKKKIEKTGGLYDGIVDNFNNIGSNLDLAIEDAVKSEVKDRTHYKCEPRLKDSTDIYN